MGGQKFRRVSLTSHCVEIDFSKINWSTKDKLRYIIGQQEICPTTGKIHWQMYAEFTDSVSMKFVKETLGDNTVHIEQAKGTALQNKAYCHKDESSNGFRFEHGKAGGDQGKRTDLLELKDQILGGQKTARDVLIEDPVAYHQYGRTIEKLQSVAERKVFRTWMTKGIWLWGATGTGKSERAFKDYNPDTHYSLNVEDSGWWEGYNGHEIVIIDDFRGNIPYAELLKLVDRNPKGVKQRFKGDVPFLAKTVIITSSMPPDRVYKNLAKEDSLEQLYRRFEVICTNAPEADGSGQRVILEPLTSSDLMKSEPFEI